MSTSVVLIQPPLSLTHRYGKDMQKFGAVTEPLGLAYIASYLEKNRIGVEIIDAPALNWTIFDVVDAVSKINPMVIGISVLTPAFNVTKDLCAHLKRENSSFLIVLGGPHPSALPKRTLSEIPAVDIVCIGEGEMTFLEIVQNAPGSRFEDIPGIYYRKNDQFESTPKREPIKNLDDIPFPARHLLPMDKYRLTASRVAGDSFCPTIIVARGCPFSCTYCSRTFGKTFRAHSIVRILKEINYLIENYHVTQVNIEADTLTVNKKFLRKLCFGLIETGLNKKIKWTCESRVDTVDEEHLRLMKKAGCWQISYGVETGNQRLLDLIQKSETIEQIETVFKLTKTVGITIRGFFMLGLPSETKEESLQTIAFAKKLDPLWAQFTVTIPYPGTDMFHDLDKKGEIQSYDWSKYNTWIGWAGEREAPFVPNGRSSKEIFILQKKALRTFYLRPVVVFRFLKTIRTFQDFKKYFSGVIVLVKSRIFTK